MKYNEGSPHISRTICTDCGIVFANPVASFDELIAFYTNYYNKGNFGLLGYKEQALKKITLINSQNVEQIRKHKERFLLNKKTGNFLDIGFGLGEELTIFNKLGFTVYGTEFDQDCINYISSFLPNAKLFCGDLLQAQYPDESFDVINICHVIEHLIDPILYIKEIKRILKVGGILVISTPNIGAPAYKAFRVLNFLSLRVPLIVDGLEHTVIFNKTNLRSVVINNGFEVIEQYSESVNDSFKNIWATNLSVKKKIFRYLQTFVKLNQVIIVRK